jgi:hypothetical protein
MLTLTLIYTSTNFISKLSTHKYATMRRPKKEMVASSCTSPLHVTLSKLLI